MIGNIGGYKRIISGDDPSQTVSRPITGQAASRYVQYRFDFQPPFHCSETEAGCPSDAYVSVGFGEGGDVRRVSGCIINS